MDCMIYMEYFGVITGLLYLYLEIKQSNAMWVVGFLTSLVYVFVFLFAKIYADMGLQMYYVGISIYGFYQWAHTKKRENSYENNNTPEAISYIHPNKTQWRKIIGAQLFLSTTLWYLLHQYTDSPIPAGDALTTAIGIVATWMLARRMIEHWYFWIFVNLVSVYLYYLRELYPTMLLYSCYAGLAIIGYYNWKKQGVDETKTSLP